MKKKFIFLISFIVISTILIIFAIQKPNYDVLAEVITWSLAGDRHGVRTENAVTIAHHHIITNGGTIIIYSGVARYNPTSPYLITESNFTSMGFIRTSNFIKRVQEREEIKLI